MDFPKSGTLSRPQARQRVLSYLVSGMATRYMTFVNVRFMFYAHWSHRRPIAEHLSQFCEHSVLPSRVAKKSPGIKWDQRKAWLGEKTTEFFPQN